MCLLSYMLSVTLSLTCSIIFHTKLLDVLWRWEICHMDICCSNARHCSGMILKSIALYLYSKHQVLWPAHSVMCFIQYKSLVTSLFLQINVVFLILVLSSICRTKRGQATKRKSMKGKDMDSNAEVVKSV